MSIRRWTLIRRGVQILVAAAYLALPFLGLERVAGTLVSLRLGPVDLNEPAAALSALLAARALSLALLVGALPVILVALGWGSIYCSWACPYGLLSEGLDALLHRGRPWPERGWEGVRRPRALGLLLLLLLSLLAGAPLAALLSPPRLVTVLPVEAWSARVFPWTTALLLLGTLTLELLGPRRIVCRALCPAGALAAWLRLPFTLRPRFEAAKCCCPAEPECFQACPWGLDPRRMGLRDGCSTCMACIELCPGEALRMGRSGGA